MDHNARARSSLLQIRDPSGLRGSPAAEPEDPLAGLGPGQMLGSRSRTTFERAYGASFSDVRIHTDGAAAGVASRASAHAFTYGADIGFARGQYRPGSLTGDVLLAHELAHVEQQRDARAADPSAVDANLERDADRAAAGTVMSSLGLESAQPQAKSGLRLARCGSERPIPDKELKPYVGMITEHVPELEGLFFDQKPIARENQLGGDDLAITLKTGGALKGGKFQIDPTFFENQFAEQDGDMFYNSDLMRGAILLHELFHDTHEQLNASAEGQAYGVEIAFLESFRKETKVWDQLDPDQQETINARIKNFGDKRSDNPAISGLEARRSALLFLILLHWVRGLDLPPEIEGNAPNLSAAGASDAIFVFMKYGLDFTAPESASDLFDDYQDDLDEDKNEALDIKAVELLKWVSEKSYAELKALRDALNAMPGPEAKAENLAKAQADAERVELEELHGQFLKKQSGWSKKHRPIMAEITKGQEKAFYRYFAAPRPGRNNPPRLRLKRLTGKNDDRIVFKIDSKDRDLIFDTTSINNLLDDYPAPEFEDPEVSVEDSDKEPKKPDTWKTQGTKLLATAYERFAAMDFAIGSKLTAKQVGFPRKDAK